MSKASKRRSPVRHVVISLSPLMHARLKQLAQGRTLPAYCRDLIEAQQQVVYDARQKSGQLGRLEAARTWS